MENGSDKSEDDNHGNKEGTARAGQVSGRGVRAPDSVVVDQTELEYWKAECREMNEKLCFLQCVCGDVIEMVALCHVFAELDTPEPSNLRHRLRHH